MNNALLYQLARARQADLLREAGERRLASHDGAVAIAPPSIFPRAALVTAGFALQRLLSRPASTSTSARARI
jgi:hypothetical protein